MELRCTLHREYPIDVLTVTGDIDMDGGDELRKAREALGTPRRPLRVDLTGVTFMDSTGAHFLTDLQQRTTAAGTSLVVAGIPAGGARLLRILGLTGFRLERPQSEEPWEWPDEA